MSGRLINAGEFCNAGKDEEFPSLAGLWENRALTIDSIRQKDYCP